MDYKQLVVPNINTSARAGMCLQYVDDALNAPKRTATAQIAYETVKSKGWITADQNYPRSVWFVMFWSIDNNDYAGLGHVALAYVDGNGNLQIHDSEVHRGARSPYGSLGEISNWFGSVGTRLTYLGWSIGVDGIKVIEKKAKTPLETNKKKGETMILFKEAGKVYLLVGNTYTHVLNPSDLSKIKTMMAKAGYDTWEHTDQAQIGYLKKLAKLV